MSLTDWRAFQLSAAFPARQSQPNWSATPTSTVVIYM